MEFVINFKQYYIIVNELLFRNLSEQFARNHHYIAGLKVVGEVKKVGKSRNFQPKVGKSRNFSTFKVGKSRNFISVFIIVLPNMVVSFVVFEANHLFF